MSEIPEANFEAPTCPDTKVDAWTSLPTGRKFWKASCWGCDFDENYTEQSEALEAAGRHAGERIGPDVLASLRLSSSGECYHGTSGCRRADKHSHLDCELVPIQQSKEYELLQCWHDEAWNDLESDGNVALWQDRYIRLHDAFMLLTHRQGTDHV